MFQDLIDVTYGYDETDPFVDDSEAVSSTLHVVISKDSTRFRQILPIKNSIHLIGEDTNLVVPLNHLTNIYLIANKNNAA